MRLEVLESRKDVMNIRAESKWGFISKWYARGEHKKWLLALSEARDRQISWEISAGPEPELENIFLRWTFSWWF